MVEVIERFTTWQPPRGLTPAVRRLLESVPRRYKAGLEAVVVSSTDVLSRHRRRRRFRHLGRKAPLAGCLGLYHPRHNSQQPWIELFVDKIADDWSPKALRFPFARDIALGQTLFHEIGHHIHKTLAPEHSNPEAVADRWRDKLLRRHFFRVYWYLLRPLSIVLSPWFAAEKTWPQLRRARRRFLDS